MFMRLLTPKDGDLSSHFDKIDERVEGITNSSLKLMFIDSPTDDDNKGKLNAHFPLERFFGFCKT